MGDEDLTMEDLELPLDETVEDELEDEGDELSGDDINAGTPPDDKSASTLASDDLVKRLTELEVSNRGLVKALSAQRTHRQDLQSKMDEVTDVLKAVVQQAGSDPKDVSLAKDIQKAVNKIQIEYDESGNPYLSTEALSKYESSTIKDLKDKIERLENATVSILSKTTEDENLNRFLSEKEGYRDAYKIVTDAWMYLKDVAFDADRIARGLPQPTSIDDALDMALTSDTLKADFAKRFPTVDMESVMEAHLLKTPRYMKKALNSVLNTPKKEANTVKDILDINKPTSLTQVNTSGGTNNESLLARIANMKPEDFNKLDAATMAKIDKLLEQFG